MTAVSRTAADIIANQATSVYSAAVLADTPLGYWRLNDLGSTAVDSSGNGLDGTLVGAITQGVAGAIGDGDAGMLFAGGYITVPDNSGFHGTNFTIEAWVTRNTNATFFDKAFVVYNATPTLQKLIQDDGSAFPGGGFRDSVSNLRSSGSSATLTLNTWYHVAITYDGSHLVWYVNGAVVQSKSITATALAGSTGSVVIGADTAAANPWPGNIDEVAFYTTGLSAARILAHYQAAHTSSDAAVRLLTFARTATETLASQTDTAIRPVMSFARAAAETLTSQTDTAIRSVMALPRTAVDTLVSQSDVAARLAAKARAAADIIANQATSVYSAAVLADTPLGYWRLNDLGSTAVDSSGNGLDGTLVGAITQGAAGAIGDGDTAMLFTGGYITIPDNSGFHGTNFTIEAWVTRTANATFFDKAFVVYNATPLLQHFIQNDGTGILQGGFRDSASAIRISGSSTIPSVGVWYHIAITYDGSHLVWYVNGAVVQSKSITATVISGSTGTVIIGADLSAANSWQGSIDEVAFYATGLSAARILAHYQAAHTSSDAANRLLTFARTAVETLTSQTDTAIRSAMAFTRTAVETLTSQTDTAIRSVMSFIRTTSDTLASQADAAVRSAAQARTAAETLASQSDSAVRLLMFVRTAPDTLASQTDMAVRSVMSFVRTAPDTLVSQTDMAIRSVMSFIRTASETLVSQTDVVVRLAAQTRTAAETLSSQSDAAVRLVVLARTAVETLASQTDMAVRSTMSFIRTAPDTLASQTDVAVRSAMTFLRTAVELLASEADAAIRLLVESRTASDTLASQSDLAARMTAVAVSGADLLVSISDLANRRFVSLVRVATDSLDAVGDVAARLLAVALAVADSLTLITDSTIRSVMSFLRAATDLTQSITDVAGRPLSMIVRTAVDTIESVTDVATRSAIAFIRTTVDVLISQVDVAVRGMAAYRLGDDPVQAVNDLASRTVRLGRAAGDVFSGLQDNAERAVMALGRVASDLQGGVADAATRFVGRFRIAADTLVSTFDEAGRPVFVLVRTAVDSVLASDAVSRYVMTLTRASTDVVSSLADLAYSVRGAYRFTVDAMGAITDAAPRAPQTLVRMAGDLLSTIHDQAYRVGTFGVYLVSTGQPFLVWAGKTLLRWRAGPVSTSGDGTNE